MNIYGGYCYADLQYFKTFIVLSLWLLFVVLWYKQTIYLAEGGILILVNVQTEN